MTYIHQEPFEKILNSLDGLDGDLWHCRFCDSPITSHNQHLSVGHNHEHCFTNPAGVSYWIRCFQHAPGCSISEQATAEHSWFGGYQWQLAHCSECQQHLGWYYFNKDDQVPGQRFFFGLIKDRLITYPSPSKKP